MDIGRGVMWGVGSSGVLDGEVTKYALIGP